MHHPQNSPVQADLSSLFSPVAQSPVEVAAVDAAQAEREAAELTVAKDPEPPTSVAETPSSLPAVDDVIDELADALAPIAPGGSAMAASDGLPSTSLGEKEGSSDAAVAEPDGVDATDIRPPTTDAASPAAFERVTQPERRLEPVIPSPADTPTTERQTSVSVADVLEASPASTASEDTANSGTTDAAPPEVPSRLVEHLRNFDNPFDVYVQSQAGDLFEEQHVFEINEKPQQMLWAVIERYGAGRLVDANVSQTADLPRSGVAVVLGNWGTGKTHLLHALRRDSRGELRPVVVAPTTFDPDRPFIEYLLSQLVDLLDRRRAEPAGGPLLNLARWMARRVMVQALFGMTDAEWLTHHAPQPGPSLFWRVWRWNSGTETEDRQKLIDSLQSPHADVVGVAQSLGHDLATLRKIAVGHVQETESRYTAGDQIRMQLYINLIELAFDPDHEGIDEFLRAGFAEVESLLNPSRDQLAGELLSALVGLYIFSGSPIVYAFDALDTLLHAPPNPERCVAFTGGLADLIDAQAGVPVFVLAERDHWQSVIKHTSQYARQRLVQGLPSVRYGSISAIDLAVVDHHQLRCVVERRLKELHKGYELAFGERTPEPIEPFTDEDIQRIGGPNEGSLRNRLRTLKALYDKIVFEKKLEPNLAARTSYAGGTAEQTGAERTAAFEERSLAWKTGLSRARSRISKEGSFLLRFSDQILNGLIRAFEAVSNLREDLDGCQVTSARSLSVGEHMTYGRLVQVEWLRQGRRHETVIGLLTAAGQGLSRDLAAKLAAVAPSEPSDRHLLILRPLDKSDWIIERGYEWLPGATREVWDETITPELQQRVQVIVVPPVELSPCLLLDDFEATVREKSPAAVEGLDKFIAMKIRPLLLKLTPCSRPASAT